MGSHPLNLLVRFLLELAALGAFGYWGWQQAEGALAYLLAIGLPVLTAVLWVTFAVPEDPSRSGHAPVPVPGLLRLLLELLSLPARLLPWFTPALCCQVDFWASLPSFTMDCRLIA